MRARTLFLVAALLTGVAALRDAGDAWVDRTVLPPLHPATSVEVRDRGGVLLRAYTVEDGLWRLGAAPDAVDPLYLDLLIGYEDRRFFDHAGVDPRAMARAVGQALWHGRVVSGGSTLTMQVARLLEDGPTGTFSGKLRQMRVAMALERQLSKDAILSLYLALAPYGGNIEGVRAATLSYFGKEPARLTPTEAALLVALPQSPEARRPDRDAMAAQAARDRVLDRAVTLGLVSEGAARAALSETVLAQKRPFPALAPHLADRAVADDPSRQRHDLTLDATLQARLERLAAEAARAAGDRLSIAMMVVRHDTGAVLASVGSAGFGAEDARQGYIDMTRALRSPGSTLKPLVYGLAMDQVLIHPDTLIDDRPVQFGTYAPQNFDGRFRGELRVAEALRLSLNIPVVTLTDEIGPARVIDGLRRAGAEPALNGAPGLAVSLGGLGMRLEDLMRLYGMMARGGTAMPLHWRVGARLDSPARVLSPASAWQIGAILAELPPPPGYPEGVLAYKTGTSYGHRDAWAIGYDGAHVIGVWMGRPDGTPVPGAFGGDLAAPVLFQAFQRLGHDPVPLPPPPPEARLSGRAELPVPLQRFRGRNAVFEAPEDAPQLVFPPDGARLPLSGPLAVKLREGRAPFSLLVNGAPVVTGERTRQAMVGPLSPGFHELTVIDAAGRADRVQIRVD